MQEKSPLYVYISGLYSDKIPLFIGKKQGFFRGILTIVNALRAARQPMKNTARRVGAPRGCRGAVRAATRDTRERSY